MILFYIHHECHGDKDAVAFVSARTRAEAVGLWQEWAHDLDLIDDPQAQPNYVFLAPRLASGPFLHPWHSSEGGVLNTERADELEVVALAIAHGVTSYPVSNAEETI